MSVQIMNGENNEDSISHYYNDDFESDSEDEIVLRRKEQNTLKAKKKGQHLGRSFSDTQAALPRNKLKRKPITLKRSSDQNEETYVTQRLLSARKNKITELRNEVKDLERQLKEVLDENRLLKRLHIRQEKELMKIDTTKSELPDIMRSHDQELQALRKQLRRQKVKNREAMENMKAKEIEILHLKGDLKVLNQICQQKDLMEREELQKKVESLEQQLSYQTTASQEYSRKLDLANKLRKQEVAAEKARFKQTKDALNKSQQRCEELNALLKDKELKLERNFIYSKRQRKPVKSTKNVKNFTSYSQEKTLSPMPSAHDEAASNVSATTEKHNSSYDSDYDHLSDHIHNDDYWLQIVEGERHEAISQGEQLLNNLSKQTLPDSVMTINSDAQVSQEIGKNYDQEESKSLFTTKSSSAELLGSIGTLTAMDIRSYSSIALTSYNQRDQNVSKENSALHHSSLSKSLSLFAEDTINHDHGDSGVKANTIDLEGSLTHSSSHKKSVIDHRLPLNGQSEIFGINSELLSPNTILANKIVDTSADDGVNCDRFPHQSNSNKTHDDTHSSWLPDIFHQSLDLH